MFLGRRVLCSLIRRPLDFYVQPRSVDQRPNLPTIPSSCKLSTYHITKNIELLTESNQIFDHGSTMESLDGQPNRPLLVILSWLLSKRRHVMKFVNLYMEQGFDVAMVTITPWQLMWPTKGSRLVAADLLMFLAQNTSYRQILLHGFSVGGYMWGEALDLIHAERQKYNDIVDRIVGQIWDSVADISELTIGTPRAVFPKNEMLRSMMEKYLEYHMRTFYNQSTQYYIRSSQLFHTTLVRSPALFLISKTDPVGTVTNNLRVRDQWDSLGIKTYVKIFDHSPHVGHFQKYPKEYVAELYGFLSRLGLIRNEEKIRARL